MKNISSLLISMLLLTSCSAPRFSYYFDHYDYGSGKKKIDPEKRLLTLQQPVMNENIAAPSPLLIEKEAIEANAADNDAPAALKKPPVATDKTVFEKKYTALSKAEKKEFRQAMKTELKKAVKAKKNDDRINDTKALDYNLKMAIIFGAIALTLSFFGGFNSVFWIASVIALVIGVVFFVKWIAEQ